MGQKLQLNRELTRDFHRAIVKEDKPYVKRLVEILKGRAGYIGMCPFPRIVMLRTIDSTVLGADRQDLNDNTEFWRYAAESTIQSIVLDGNPSWIFDWIWFPVE